MQSCQSAESGPQLWKFPQNDCLIIDSVLTKKTRADTLPN